ncbi:MAG: hypothetical protein HKN59_00345 [Gammaproteobacteria bacterium]|nr:hypothetical protein [Gammaproteobacteria bacterium]
MKRTQFIQVLVFSIAMGPFMVTEAAHSSPVPVDWTDCARNCVEIKRSGDELLFFARDGKGEVFKTAHVSLPRDAQAVIDPERQVWQRSGPVASPFSGLPVGSTCGSVSGVCTEHASFTYETPTQFIVVTITYFFVNGELQNVEVDETRLNKSKIK